MNTASSIKPLTVAYIGAYDPTHSNNTLIIKALRKNNITVHEINASNKVTLMEDSDSTSPLKLVQRILRRFNLIPVTLANLDKIRQSDALYIGYPGHLDVVWCWLVAQVLGKKLFFYPLVTLSVGFTEEKKLLNRGGVLFDIIKNFEKFVYKLPDVLIADTPFQKEFLSSHFHVPNKNIEVLPIGADDEVYKFTGYTPYKKGDELVVVYYGLYSQLHGVETIIKAAEKMKNISVTFLLVGKGYTLADNQTLAKKLNLTNIKFLTALTEANSLATLSKGHIFLGFFQKHPIVDRVVGNKVYQGMSLGKAVVTAESKAVRSLFNDREDVLFTKPSDSSDLAEKIGQLYKNPNLLASISKNSHEKFIKQYSTQTIGQKLQTIISSHLH